MARSVAAAATGAVALFGAATMAGEVMIGLTPCHGDSVAIAESKMRMGVGAPPTDDTFRQA